MGKMNKHISVSLVKQLQLEFKTTSLPDENMQIKKTNLVINLLDYKKQIITAQILRATKCF